LVSPDSLFDYMTFDSWDYKNTRCCFFFRSFGVISFKALKTYSM